VAPERRELGVQQLLAGAHLGLAGGERVLRRGLPGLGRTTPELRQTAGASAEIPAAVSQREGYNHIGDPTWNPGEGGRVLLPMESRHATASRGGSRGIAR
jgi:hypothetical protein